MTLIAKLPSRSAPRRLCPPRPPPGPAAVSGGTLYGGVSLPRLGPALPAAMQSRVLCLGGGAGAPAARRVRLLLRQVLAGGAAAARPGRLEVRALHGSGNHPADTRPRLPSAFSPCRAPCRGAPPCVLSGSSAAVLGPEQRGATETAGGLLGPRLSRLLYGPCLLLRYWVPCEMKGSVLARCSLPKRLTHRDSAPACEHLFPQPS